MLSAGGDLIDHLMIPAELPELAIPGAQARRSAPGR
jgi:hypothetical protein